MFHFFFSNFKIFHHLMLKSILIALLIVLSGCSSIPFLGEESDYRTSEVKNEPKKLEVPPDLITPAKDRKFSIPSSGSTMSEFELSIKKDGFQEGEEIVLPNIQGMEIRSYGNHRVLLVEKPVEYLWPVLRNFWITSGFVISREVPEIGLLETDWFEDRRNMPKDFIRGILGKVFQNIYDTGERDRYKMRLERISENKTEISVAHRGLIEVVAKKSDGTISWQNKPTDRKLEEDYLKQIMISLGAKEEKAESSIKRKDSSSQVVLTSDESTAYIKILENFDRSWRRVGMAIDRLEFSVEDRSRADGIYFIKYRDPTIGNNKEGFFSNLFGFGKNSKKIQTYKVKLISDEEVTQVFIIDEQGKNNSNTTKSIASVLFDQLK